MNDVKHPVTVKKRLKCRISCNKWGNWSGYIGIKKVMWFHDSYEKTQEQNAIEWKAKFDADQDLLQKEQLAMTDLFGGY